MIFQQQHEKKYESERIASRIVPIDIRTSSYLHLFLSFHIFQRIRGGIISNSQQLKVLDLLFIHQKCRLCDKVWACQFMDKAVTKKRQIPVATSPCKNKWTTESILGHP